jgi:AAA ATPase domain
LLLEHYYQIWQNLNPNFYYLCLFMSVIKLITEIMLKNFKCFSDHTVPFRPNTIIVGENNAGKSTLIEALRILSVVTSKYENLNYIDLPEWLENKPSSYRGIIPSFKDYELNFDESIFYQYRSPPRFPPVEIKASFDNGCTVEI